MLHPIIREAIRALDFRTPQIEITTLADIPAGTLWLDGEDARIRASGNDVIDVSLVKRLARWMDFNLSVDNVANKRYFETQNFYASRVAPGAPLVERIHATPGYPITLSMGLTFRFGAKD